MGLAAPKNRVRISNDPQNTTWANNTSRFGHRMLTSQGWTPGSSLGAKDAAHAEHYTAASSSHIRVLLKEDTLGLGAKRGSERPENFGLAALASVLGRLNGNEVDVKKEEERRLEIERRGYVARKYGFMNFVSGGFLVGDKIEKKSRKEIEQEAAIKEEDVSSEDDKKSKKRKRSKEAEEVKEESVDDEPKLKRKKKSMNLRDAAAAEDEAEKSKSKKERKKSKKASVSEPTSLAVSEPLSPAPVSDEPLSDKAKRKAEKRARKEEKKLKKALKKAAKEAARSQSTSNDAGSVSSSEDDATDTPTSSSVPTTGTSTPSGLTFAAGGRHAARARYIRQKKMAGMDPQALKEIFMIKSPA